jgi:hypothetical protein
VKFTFGNGQMLAADVAKLTLEQVRNHPLQMHPNDFYITNCLSCCFFEMGSNLGLFLNVKSMASRRERVIRVKSDIRKDLRIVKYLALPSFGDHELMVLQA